MVIAYLISLFVPKTLSLLVKPYLQGRCFKVNDCFQGNWVYLISLVHIQGNSFNVLPTWLFSMKLCLAKVKRLFPRNPSLPVNPWLFPRKLWISVDYLCGEWSDSTWYPFQGNSDIRCLLVWWMILPDIPWLIPRKLWYPLFLCMVKDSTWYSLIVSKETLISVVH